MTRCTECQTEWTFKDKARVFKKLSFSLIQCPYCGADQFINSKSQKQTSLANMIIPLTMFLPLLIPIDVPLSIHIPLIVIGIVAVIILNIALIKLSKEQEYLI